MFSGFCGAGAGWLVAGSGRLESELELEDDDDDELDFDWLRDAALAFAVPCFARGCLANEPSRALCSFLLLAGGATGVSDDAPDNAGGGAPDGSDSAADGAGALFFVA